MRWLLVVVAVVAVTLMVAGIWALARQLRGVDKDAYLRGNAEILDDVPVYPGAAYQRTMVHSEPDLGRGPPIGEGGPPRAYASTRVYKLPPDTTAPQVKAFYRDALEPQWRFVGPISDSHQASFRRGEASLGVLVTGTNTGLLLRADHAGYRR